MRRTEAARVVAMVKDTHTIRDITICDGPTDAMYIVGATTDRHPPVTRPKATATPLPALPTNAESFEETDQQSVNHSVTSMAFAGGMYKPRKLAAHLTHSSTYAA